MVLTLTDEESLTLEKLNIVTSVFSICGSLFIMSFFFVLKDLRTFAFKLVCMVAVSDVFFSIGNFMGDAGGDSTTHLGASPAFCMTQALFIGYFQLTSLFWAISIAFTLHMAFLRENPDFAPSSIHEHDKKYHLVCWGIPLILTILPLFTGSYGDTGGWCWIMSRNAMDNVWRFLQFYLWLFLGIGYNCFVFLSIFQKIKQMQAMSGEADGLGRSRNTMAGRLRLYPLVLLICHLPGTISILYELGGTQSFILNVLTVIFGSLWGLANALVYGLTPEVAQQVKAKICSGGDRGSHMELEAAA